MSKSVFLYKDTSNQENIIPKDVVHVKIDASAQMIDDEAFKNCKDLRTVDFSEAASLVMIGEEAFAGCVSLQEANLTGVPQLEYICHRAFQGCNSLEIVGILPPKLDRIGESAFAQDSREFEPDRPSFKALDISSAKSLRYIYKGAFVNCKFEHGVKFPAKLEAIAEKAFENASMHRLDFDSARSLRFIGNSAFSNTQLEGEVRFPPMLGTIGDEAFRESSVKGLDFSGADWSLRKIGVAAFAHCQLETEVRLPAVLEELGDEAFSGSSMKRLDMSAAKRLRVICRWSFARCSIENDVKFSSKVRALGQRCFTGSSMRRLDFSEATSLRMIGHSAFENCQIEDEVELPANLEEIWPRAFAKARASSVNLSMCKNLKRNAENAFEGSLYNQMICSLDSDDEEGVVGDIDNLENQQTLDRSNLTTSTLKLAEEELSLDEMDLEPLPNVQKEPLTFNGAIVKNSGWLEKKSKKRSMFLQSVWEKRYFVLQEDGVLHYSKHIFIASKEGMVKTKKLSNVVVEKSKSGESYEVRDRETSKQLLVLRAPGHGSTWESSKEIMEETYRSFSSLSLGPSSTQDLRIKALGS